MNLNDFNVIVGKIGECGAFIINKEKSTPNYVVPTSNFTNYGGKKKCNAHWCSLQGVE